AARGSLVAEAVAEDLVGKIKLDLVELAVLLDVRLVVITGDADLLQRYRYLGRRDVAQFVEGGEEALVARDKADPHARQVRALRERVEGRDILVIRTGRFEHAAWRCLASVDFRIALVAEHEKAVRVSQRLQLPEVGTRCQ